MASGYDDGILLDLLGDTLATVRLRDERAQRQAQQAERMRQWRQSDNRARDEAMGRRPIEPTDEYVARMADDGAELIRAVVDGKLARIVEDTTTIGQLRGRDVIDDDQYRAARWLQTKHQQSLHSVGSVEMRERVDCSGTITPEMIIAAARDIQAAFAVIRINAGRDIGPNAAIAVERVVLLDWSLEHLRSHLRVRRHVERDLLLAGLDALAAWRARK